jgi:DNA-binding SARP family transcriptional activator/predicted ATPase
VPADLEIQLLGDVRITHRARVVPLDSPRLQALLAYLILHRGSPQQRRRAAFLFWPESTESQALTNLRQLLHHLRRALPGLDGCVDADRRTIVWKPDAPARIDVVELEAACEATERASAEGDVSSAILAAERASACYAGDLLPDCYDEWLEPERDRLRRATRGLLERLIGWLEARQEPGRALGHAARLLELDPLGEPGHRARIRLLALVGDRAGAVRAFQECAAVLERELGVEPSPETRALCDRIRSGEPAEADRPLSGPSASPIALVGRAAEWERLREAFPRAADGPRVVVITGEAGIGKTRLAEALVDWAAAQGTATARARCWAAEGLLPLAPVAEWLRSPGLRDGVAALEPAWRAEVSRVLPELGADGGDPTGAAEPWRRTRLFEALARAVGAGDEPRILLLDDLQWGDGDTLEWLHYLLRRAPGPPLLLVATLRSGEPATHAGLSGWLLQLRQLGLLDSIALEALDLSQTAALGEAVAGRALQAAEAAELHRQTEGSPLFIVETVRSRLSGDDGGPVSAASEAPVPPRVHAVIRGRLDRLGPDAAELVTLLATLGRDFTLPLLRAAEPQDPARLARALDELVQAHIIRERDGAYQFGHDKIREVAYAEAGGARRALLHERAARALAAASAGPVGAAMALGSQDETAGEIARHFERAGLAEAAIPWFRRAADRARSVFANREAADHLERALELLGGLPESAERDEQELELQTALGVPLVALHHYSGQRVWRTYRRARELCDRLGRRPSPPILRALALAGLMRSRLPDVVELGDELVQSAEASGDPMLRVEAQYVLGVARYWQGAPGAARDRLRRALDLYDPARGADHLRLFTQDPGVVCGVRLALAEWHLGDPKTAHRRCLQAVRRAEDLAHPFSLAYARLFGTWVLLNCDDLAEARRQITALLRESEQHGMSVWPAMGGIIEGWLMTTDGRGEEGIERMRRAMAAFAADDVDLGFPYHQGLYADACHRLGRPERGLAAVDEALAMAERTGERFWDPELHRLRGALLQATDAPAAAVEDAFRRGLDAARSQGAPTLERRIVATQNAAGTVHR